MTLNWAHRDGASSLNSNSPKRTRGQVAGEGGGGGGSFIGRARMNRISDLQHQHLRPSLRLRVSYLKRALGQTFEEYCSRTKVNGPYYWQKGVTRGRRGRIMWTIIPLGLMVTGLILVFSLWQRYLASPTRMTIGRPLFVTQVPFPAVSICHPRFVVEYKAAEFVERM